MDSQKLSDEQKKVIEQVNKLLALSKSSNEHEAALALAKVEELLEKYRLDMTQIEMMTGKKEEIIEDEEPLFDSEDLSDWESRLGHRIAILYGCMTIQLTDYAGVGKTLKIIGRPSDILFVRYLVSYITLELFRLSVGPLYKKRKDFKSSWFKGAVDTIIHRLNVQKQQTQQQYKDQFTVVTINNRVNEAYEKLKEIHKDDTLSNREDKEKIRQDAYWQGKDAGDKIKLTHNDKLNMQ